MTIDEGIRYCAERKQYRIDELRDAQIEHDSRTENMCLEEITVYNDLVVYLKALKDIKSVTDNIYSSMEDKCVDITNILRRCEE